MFTQEQIETIVTAELYSLLWSEGEIYDENGDVTLESWLDYYTAYNSTPELRAMLTEELEQWDATSSEDEALAVYIEHFGHDWLSSFGHDLALTRNGHGVGFWDRGLGEAGRVLTDWAESLGTLHVFHGHASIYPEWEGMFHAE